MKAAEINDGGPAFPVSEILASDGSHDRRAQDGMSLRDYFAAKALSGIFAMVAAGAHDTRDITSRSPEEKLAKDAYRMADAMLKARQA